MMKKISKGGRKKAHRVKRLRKKAKQIKMMNSMKIYI